ncbi:MAG TPA: trypsin-like peptidase domain-containing protein [Patescibacteria group bacterium]|nr:trypsin-like peptidase domain-containing protein [Patescibacteria group bacterium]
MRPFESKFARIFPYILGTLFGLSIALFVVSIVLLKRTAEREPLIPLSSVDSSLANSLIEGSPVAAAMQVVTPAVVSVTAYRTEIVYAQPRSTIEWFLQYSGRMPARYSKKYPILGSGLIINPNGYILTNEHVISDAEEIYVTMTDSTEVAAALVGASPEYDLALLKIEGSDFPYAALGNSDNLYIGQTVIAIGSPFPTLFNDTQPTVTAGVISALHRDIKPDDETRAIFKNMIQTDAAINPGNSGGPLVSSRGEVVGVNTFIFSTASQNSLGMGFAIPSNTARVVVEEIMRFGRMRDVWTGLVVAELSEELAARMNVTFNQGLYVQRVERESPAAQAGLEVGDVIVKVNDVRILSLNQANRLIFGKRVGETIRIVVLRGDKTLEMELQLAERIERA